MEREGRWEGSLRGARVTYDFDFGLAGGAFDGEGKVGLEMGDGVFKEDEGLVRAGGTVTVAEG